MLETYNLRIEIAKQLICRDLTLKVSAGEMLGILGKNGSGKTTLLHAFANLHPLKTGDIHWQQKNLQAYARKTLSQQLGILFQHVERGFADTVFEFCLSGRHPHLSAFSWEGAYDHALTNKALESLDLANKLDQDVTTLSGGEFRRLLIATLLTQAPQLFLLDEPTNHLDIHHQIKVLNLFKTLVEKNEAGVIITLHDIHFAQHYCTKILMLFDNGETLLGNPEEILTKENLTRLYNHPVELLSGKTQRCWLPEFK